MSYMEWFSLGLLLVLLELYSQTHDTKYQRTLHKLRYSSAQQIAPLHR